MWALLTSSFVAISSEVRNRIACPSQDDIFLAGVGAAGEHMEADPSPVSTDLFHHPVKLKDSGQTGLLEQFAVCPGPRCKLVFRASTNVT